VSEQLGLCEKGWEYEYDIEAAVKSLEYVVWVLLFDGAKDWILLLGLATGGSGFGMGFGKGFDAAKERDTSGKPRERLRVSILGFLSLFSRSISSSSTSLFDEFPLTSFN
jgi:hypothetical protein